MRDPIPTAERERAALTIRPVGNKVLALIEPVLEQSQGGILLGPAQIELDEYEIIRVLRVGEGRHTKRGTIPPGYDEHERPRGFQPGDRMCIWRGHGTTVAEIDGADWGVKGKCRVVMLREDQVVPALLPDGELRLRRRKDKRTE